MNTIHPGINVSNIDFTAILNNFGFNQQLATSTDIQSTVPNSNEASSSETTLNHPQTSSGTATNSENESQNETRQLRNVLASMQEAIMSLENRIDSFQPVVAGSSHSFSSNMDLSQQKLSKSLSVAPFWKNDPELWFAVLEKKFLNAEISNDDVKYNKVIDTLDESIVVSISKIIRNPPAFDKYEAIKQSLLQTYQISNDERLHVLLNQLFLGDNKPSQLYQQMQNISSQQISDELLLTIWIKKLPSNIQQHIRGMSKITNTKDLLLIADGMAEAPVNTNQQNLVSTSTEEEHQLIQKVDALVNSLNKKQNPKQFPQTKFDNNFEDSGFICYYHKKFGSNALRCTYPCLHHSEFLKNVNMHQ